MVYWWIFISCIVIFLFWLWVTRQCGWLDKPGKDVPKRNRVPTLQWITLIVWFIIICAVRYPSYISFSVNNPFFGLLLWGWLVAVLSFIDELWLILHKKYRISAWVRLLWHVGAALIAYSVSGVGITEFQLPWWVLIEFWTFSILLLTVGRYLMFINAINWFDGVYGLASWISSIWFYTIVLLLGFVVFKAYPDMSVERMMLLTSVYNMAFIFWSLSLVAFVMEWKPWWLMRDVGTMFLWFALAYLALLWWAKIGMMIVVLALPLFDAIWVIIDRLHRRKKHPFHGDLSHLHHRLLALNRNRNEVRIAILLSSVLMLIMMLLLGDDRMWKVIIFVLIACVFFGVNAYLYWIKWFPVEFDPKK